MWRRTLTWPRGRGWSFATLCQEELRNASFMLPSRRPLPDRDPRPGHQGSRPDPDETTTLDRDFSDALHSGSQLLVGVLDFRFHWEEIAAFGSSGDGGQ